MNRFPSSTRAAFAPHAQFSRSLSAIIALMDTRMSRQKFAPRRQCAALKISSFPCKKRRLPSNYVHVALSVAESDGRNEFIIAFAHMVHAHMSLFYQLTLYNITLMAKKVIIGQIFMFEEIET
jgi:hypothetical protein